jgi:hypothetical protein
MHGLRTIVKLNKVEQDFVDHILTAPIKDVNLLDVWKEWKALEAQERAKVCNEPVSLHTD